MLLTACPGSYPKICDDPGAVNLRRELNRFDKGEITARELEAAYRDTTARVIREQEEAGLDLLTDGMIRWDDPLSPFTVKVEGLQRGGLTRYFDNNYYYRKPIVVGKVLLRETATEPDYLFATSQTRRPVKAVIPGPYTFARLSEDRYYKDIEKLTVELAMALRYEVKVLAMHKVPVIQIDEPALCFNPEHVALAREGVRILTQGLRPSFYLSLYFGPIAGIYSKLMEFPVTGLALDLVSREENLATVIAEGSSLDLCLGLIDARNTLMEEEEVVVAHVTNVEKRAPGRALYLSANTGLEYLPHSSARAKLELLSICARVYNAHA